MAMKQETDTAVANSAYGKPLSFYKDKDGKVIIRKLKYTFNWTEYPDVETMVESKDEMSLDEQLRKRNTDRKTKARQAQFTKEMTALGIEPPNAESDSVIRLKKVADGLYGKYVSGGMSPDEARAKSRAKASELLEEEWPKSDDDDTDTTDTETVTE